MKHLIYRLFAFLFALVFLGGNVLLGQQVAKSTQETTLLQNATLYTITQGTIIADLLIVGDKIAEIGKDLPTSDARVIDCTGKRIYPGFVDSGCKIGLAEISSVSLTQDYNELGTYTPHMKALTAVNPNSVHIPITRVNGVTTAFTYPDGSLFPGKGALIHLQGYTPEQMSAGFEGNILKWPSSGRRGRWDKRSTEEIETDRTKAMKKLNDFWQSVVVYSQLDANDATYMPQLSALAGVANGTEKLLIEVNKRDDILEALKWSQDNKIDAILTGVAEGWRVADSLAKYEIPVITGPILQNPSRDSDKYDTPYSNAAKMHEAGVLVAIRTDESENVRNLPFNAAFAANYGLGIEEALKAITINPATMFGIADRVGSLEEGKLANLFICDGDPFEMKTRISGLFINGWNIPIESRQTLLYDEFLERNPGVQFKD